MKQDITEICNVKVIARNKETNEIVLEREGHNVWTLYGREYSCMLKSYDANGSIVRDDRIFYVGLGAGAQPETVNVSALVDPLGTNNNGQWLKPIDFTRSSFSTAAYKTSIRYVCIFDENDIVGGENGTSFITECGLFTDGLQAAPYTRTQRANSLATALSQSPVAYHSFEPIPKNPSIQLEIIWELRH